MQRLAFNRLFDNRPEHCPHGPRQIRSRVGRSHKAQKVQVASDVSKSAVHLVVLELHTDCASGQVCDVYDGRGPYPAGYVLGVGFPVVVYQLSKFILSCLSCWKAPCLEGSP